MKRITILLFTLFLLFLFLSCSNSVEKEEPFIEEDAGYLLITIPDGSTRSISSNEAISIANFYEVFAWSSTGILYAANVSASVSNTATVTLPPGEYKMVAFGGYQRDGYTGYHGLGSAYAEGIVIQSGKTTEVSVELIPFEIDVEIEETEYKIQEEIPIKVSINLHNEHIALSVLRGTVIDQNSGSAKSWHSMEMWSAKPDSTENGKEIYTFNCTAPAVAGTYYIEFGTDGILLHDSDLPRYSSPIPASYYPALFNGTGGTMNPALAIDGGNTTGWLSFRNIIVTEYPSFLAVNISWASN